jgi:hypothetical protein
VLPTSRFAEVNLPLTLLAITFCVVTGKTGVGAHRRRVALSDDELLKFGKAAKYTCSPYANIVQPRRQQTLTLS